VQNESDHLVGGCRFYDRYPWLVGIFNQSIQVLRPKQWIKNFLILAAPIASTKLTEYYLQVALGFVTFICASSLGYIINDWVDRESDRLHKSKSLRPFASGTLGKTHFLVLFILLSAFTAMGALYLGRNFLLVVVMYLVVTFLYTLVIKNVPIVEMIWLATGFLIRAVAGSILVNTNPTGWFNITVFFSSLFIVACKRFSEKFNSERQGTRKVLEDYDQEVLSSIVNIAASATLLTYCLWVIQEHFNSYLAQISILPFVAFILLYKNISKSALAEAPEDVLLNNKPVLICALISTILFGIVFYQ